MGQIHVFYYVLIFFTHRAVSHGVQMARLPLVTRVNIDMKRGCNFGCKCQVLTCEITHFSDSKYHVVGFIFTDFCCKFVPLSV